jgi:hypothetical protein
VIQHVDRTHKSDRLEASTQIGGQPALEHRDLTPVGCDTVFSPLLSLARNPAARCLT